MVEVSDGEETGKAGGEKEVPARETWVTRRAGEAEQDGEEAVPGGGRRGFWTLGPTWQRFLSREGSSRGETPGTPHLCLPSDNC